MAKEYKYRPRRNYFDYVEIGETTIHKISTEYQPEDYLTKLLDEHTHVNHRKEVQG